MKRIFTVILILFSLGAFSQGILLQQNVKADSIRPTRGPNLKNYIHGYIGVGFPSYTNEAKDYTKPVLSTDFNFGTRYKRKITNYMAIGLDLGLTSTAYRIKQNASKTVPDAHINDKEKIQVNALVSSAYLRINVGRRGNFIGNYLDLGAYGGWNFQKKHKTTNTDDEGEKVKVMISKLNYIESFSYGMISRIGMGRYAFTARYRLSDIFKSSFAMPELPRLIVGFEVGLLKK